MEALRNYVQHEDLGVHTVRIDGAWIEGDGKKSRRYVVSIGLDLDHLSKARKFKASVLTELKTLTAAPDLKQIIREYISALGTAHHKMRTALKPQLEISNTEILSAFNDVQIAYPNEKLRSLMIFKQHANGTRTKLQELSQEPIERLRALQLFNQTTLNLGPAYASSEALPAKPKKS